MSLATVGRAGARMVLRWCASAAVLACAMIAGRASAQDAVQASMPAAPDSSGASVDSKAATLTEEGKWLASNLPKLGRAQVLLESSERIGGTDVSSGRKHVVRAKLDRCTLTVDEIFDWEGVSNPTGGIRASQIVPLQHADPASVGVQQRPPVGSSFGMVSGEPWRVTLVMQDGSIRTDLDALGRRRSVNSGDFDLIVTDRQAGLEVVTHLRNVITACR